MLRKLISKLETRDDTLILCNWELQEILTTKKIGILYTVESSVLVLSIDLLDVVDDVIIQRLP